MSKTLSAFKSDSKNANRHTARGGQMMERSIEECGFGDSMTVTADDVIISGNQRAETCFEKGMVEPIIIESDGTRPIIHKRTDLLSTDARAKRLGILLNRVGEVNLDWNPEVIQELAEENGTLDGLFSDDELTAILEQLKTENEAPEDKGAEIDRAAELQEKWQVKRGDLFSIGSHRLLCGDSTSREDVERLMDGKRAAMAWCDPPFGIELKPQRGLTDEIVNDGNDEAREVWRRFVPLLYDCLADNSSAFLCQGWTEFDWTLPLLRDHFMLKSKVVWKKNVWGIGYYLRPQHEDVIYCWKGTPAKPVEPISDVWEVARESAPIHAAEKPPELSTNAIRMATSKGDLMVDLFVGVGGAMVAAEQTNRICYAMELEEKFCSVICERMSNLNLEVKLLDG